MPTQAAPDGAVGAERLFASAGGWLRANISWIRLVAVPIIIGGTHMSWLGSCPNPTRVPEPKLLFIAGKDLVTPTRLIQ